MNSEETRPVVDHTQKKEQMMHEVRHPLPITQNTHTDLLISKKLHHTVELLLLPEHFRKKQVAFCCCSTYTHITDRELVRQREGACVN